MLNIMKYLHEDGSIKNDLSFNDSYDFCEYDSFYLKHYLVIQLHELNFNIHEMYWRNQ